MFPSATEDAVLLDAERAAISPALRLSTDRIDEAVYAVLARLARVGDRRSVTLQLLVPGHPRVPRDLRVVADAAGVSGCSSRDAALSYQQMKAALGEPKSVVPADRRRARPPTAAGGCAASSAPAPRASTPSAARSPAWRTAARPRRQRASDEFTEFDGYVPEAGVVLDPCAPGHRVFGDGAGRRRGVSVPLLPQARPGHPAGRRARARQGRLARSADARARSCTTCMRRCCGAAATPAAVPTRSRMVPGCMSSRRRG